MESESEIKTNKISILSDMDIKQGLIEEIFVVVHTTETVHRPEILAVRSKIAGDRIARKPDSSNGLLVKIKITQPTKCGLS